MGHLRPLGNIYITKNIIHWNKYIAIQKISKLQSWIRNKSNFIVGVTTIGGTILKDHNIRKFRI